MLQARHATCPLDFGFSALEFEQIGHDAGRGVLQLQKAAEIAKKAYQQGRPVIDVALEHTDLPRSKLEVLLDPEKLTAGGV